MEAGIIKECKRKMYDAIWLEIDKNPEQPQGARVDIVKPSGSICIWCHPEGNTAVVTHNFSHNDSERLETAIEECVDYSEVVADYYRENPDCCNPMDTYNECRLDELMKQFSC